MANFWRLWKILYVFTRYRLDDLIPTEQFPLPLRIALWLAPWRLAPVPKKLSRGERLRLALEALGPIFVKFGQILSRLDKNSFLLGWAEYFLVTY